MQTIAAGTFKAKCLAIMDKVQTKREVVIITKNGKPVARLLPIQQKKEEVDSIFGFYAGKLTIHGNVESPAIPQAAWARLQ